MELVLKTNCLKGSHTQRIKPFQKRTTNQAIKHHHTTKHQKQRRGPCCGLSLGLEEGRVWGLWSRAISSHRRQLISPPPGTRRGDRALLLPGITESCHPGSAAGPSCSTCPTDLWQGARPGQVVILFIRNEEVEWWGGGVAERRRKRRRKARGWEEDWRSRRRRSRRKSSSQMISYIRRLTIPRIEQESIMFFRSCHTDTGTELAWYIFSTETWASGQDVKCLNADLKDLSSWEKEKRKQKRIRKRAEEDKL